MFLYGALVPSGVVKNCKPRSDYVVLPTTGVSFLLAHLADRDRKYTCMCVAVCIYNIEIYFYIWNVEVPY